MELQQAIKEAINNPGIKSADISMFNQMLKSQKITGLQQEFAVKALKRYGIEVRTEVEGRRAVLRENIIYCFGKLSRDELIKLNNIPGTITLREHSSVPCNKYSIRVLRELRYKFSQNLIEREKENSESVEIKDGLRLPKGLLPFPYQYEGWRKIEEFGGRCIVADQPRMGKTIQAIMYMVNHPELRPALIIVPSSIKLQWQREVNKWMPGEKCTVINGKKSEIPKEGIVIINYDILYNYFSFIEDVGFKIAIPDEVHRIKNMNSQRSKAFKYLSANIPHIIGLSGTPISNRPSEFFVILNILNREMFNSHQKYLDRYCNAKKDPSARGASNIQELHDILKKTLLIRRLRSEVWQDIEERQKVIIPVEIDNRAEYQEAEQDLIAYLRKTKGNRAAQNAIRSQALAKFNVLKEISSRGKLKQALDWIEDFTEAEKLATFCINRNMVEEINNHFKGNSVKLYGGMSNKQKDEAVSKFTNDPNIDLFVGNIEACKEGLPLHVADCTLTLQLDWVPSNHEQCDSRVINKDKLHVPITSYYMIAIDTIEETIATMIDKKEKVLSKLLDGEEIEEESLLTALIEKYSNL